jgi:hypothetical protein
MTSRSWVFLAVSLIGPIVLLWAVYELGLEEAGFPERNDLTCTVAKVLKAERVEYGVRIEVVGIRDRIFYRKKSGAFDEVVDAVASSANQPITFCYLAQNVNDPPDPRGLVVFEIRSRNGMIRSLDQVRDSWRKDNRFLFILIPAVLVGSSYLAFRAGRFR